MAPDQLVETGVGSTDWAGGKAPAGGTHTGVTVVTMTDGATYTVACSAAEVLTKRDQHAIAQTVPQWVAFDVPLAAVPVILNVSNIGSVIQIAEGPVGPKSLVPYPAVDLFPGANFYPDELIL
jgi:hypothetical protein